MKPNFDEMSRAELKAYVLSHRDDDEAIRVFLVAAIPRIQKRHGTVRCVLLKAHSIAENIRIAEEAIKKRVDIDREKQQQREKAQEEGLRQKLEREIEQKLRAKIELEVEQKLQENLEKEIEALISAIAKFLAATSGFSSKLAGSIALLAIQQGIEDFGDFDKRWN